MIGILNPEIIKYNIGMSNRVIPFYSNTPDDTHCFQAALKMILKYFLPTQDFSWKQIDKITAKKEGLWTWPFAGMLWLHAQGFQVINQEVFDYQRFVQEKNTYLIDFYGKEVGKAQIGHSDVNQEAAFAKELLKGGILKDHLPTLEDIQQLVIDNYLLICNVNSCALSNKQGYVGHFIVVKEVDDQYVYFHDPGLPPLKDRRVPIATFMHAWAYPNETSQNVLAIRKI